MKCPFFGSLFALFYIGVKWRGETVGDKLKIGVVWDTGYLMVQRNSQRGDRMLSQTTVTYTGT